MDFSIAEDFKENGYPKKAVEKASIYEIIFKGEATSRKKLAHFFQIRPNNISEHVNELIDEGLIYEIHQSNIGKKGGLK